MAIIATDQKSTNQNTEEYGEDIYTGYNAEDFEESTFPVDDEFIEGAEYLTPEEAASLRGEFEVDELPSSDKPADKKVDEDDGVFVPKPPKYDAFGKNMNAIDYDPEQNKPRAKKKEQNFYEMLLHNEFSEEEIEEQRRKNRRFLNKDRDRPVEGDKKVQGIREALEAGIYDYDSDVSKFDDHLEFMDAVQDMLMQSPLFILDQLREKKAKEAARAKAEELKATPGRVNIRDLCQAIDETYQLTKESNISAQIKVEITNSMGSLMDICKNVFSQSSIYTDSEIAELIGMLNKVCENKEYLTMAYANDIYFKFVVDYANNLLLNHKEVPSEIISAFNLLIKANAKLLNVIIREKTEAYSPIISLINNMKKNNKL